MTEHDERDRHLTPAGFRKMRTTWLVRMLERMADDPFQEIAKSNPVNIDDVRQAKGDQSWAQDLLDGRDNESTKK